MVRGKSTRGTQGQPRGQLAVRTARGEACGVVWRWPGADLGTCERLRLWKAILRTRGRGEGLSEGSYGGVGQRRRYVRSGATRCVRERREGAQ